MGGVQIPVKWKKGSKGKDMVKFEIKDFMKGFRKWTITLNVTGDAYKCCKVVNSFIGWTF